LAINININIAINITVAIITTSMSDIVVIAWKRSINPRALVGIGSDARDRVVTRLQPLRWSG